MSALQYLYSSFHFLILFDLVGAFGMLSPSCCLEPYFKFPIPILLGIRHAVSIEVFFICQGLQQCSKHCLPCHVFLSIAAQIDSAVKPVNTYQVMLSITGKQTCQVQISIFSNHTHKHTIARICLLPLVWCICASTTPTTREFIIGMCTGQFLGRGGLIPQHHVMYHSCGV